MTCLMAVVEQTGDGVQANPYVPPQCPESLERLCTCWGQPVPYCLRCKVGLAEAAAAHASKPHCTDEVCYERSGCNSSTWGGGPRYQEWPKAALSGYRFNYKYHAHLKQFLRRTFRFRPYVVQEYPNDDDNGYLTDDDDYHSKTEATVQWTPRVEYPAAYVHLSWCRRSCGCCCNPTGRGQDFPAYRHSDYCRGGCRNKCADSDGSTSQVPAVEVVEPAGGWAELGHDGDVSYCCGLPYYAPTDGDTSGHDGDVDQSADEADEASTPRYAPTDDGTAASGDLSPVTPASARDEPESDCSGAGSDTELTCLMADVAPLDQSERDSKFSWSMLQDGTGVAVHVQGVPKATVTPDATNRRFNADFAADTGLNGSPAARAQMNA